MKEYLIDGEPVEWQEIIKRARQYGYDGDFLQTSIAAGILRDNGHTVERNPAPEALSSTE